MCRSSHDQQDRRLKIKTKSRTRRRVFALALAAAASSAQAEVLLGKIFSQELKFEALFQLDADYFSNHVRANSRGGAPLTPTQNASNTLIDDTGVRRAEFVLFGKNANTDWAVGYDARAQRWLDAVVRYKFDNGSNLRWGQFKQPNSLEELTSTRHNDFAAKSLTTSAFALGRRLGVSYTRGGQVAAASSGAGKEWSATAAAFTRELSNNLQKANGYAVRGTFAPWLVRSQTTPTDAENVLHLGISAVHYTPSKDIARVNARPEADFANLRLVDSLNLTATASAQQLGLETAWLYGPLKVSAEHVSAHYTRRAHPDYAANSSSVSLVYNLTGQRFGYSGGVYKVLPSSADQWQLAARYSALDANDGTVLGGTEQNITLGVNFYWRENFKFTANVSQVRSSRLAISNDPIIIELRAQFML